MTRISFENRKLILDKWCGIKGISFRTIAKQVKVSTDSVRRIINKFGEHHSLNDLPKSGRKKGPSNKKLEQKVVSLYKTKKGLSVRDAAKKAGTSPSMIQRVKKRNNLKVYKRQRNPIITEKQAITIKKRVHKFYDDILTKK